MTIIESIVEESNVESLYAQVWALAEGMASVSQERFPLFSIPGSQTWRWSRRGSWMGGFWSAIWWLRARLDDGDGLQRAAETQRRLELQLGTDSVHRALIFWFGAGTGSVWCGHSESQRLAQDALAALLGSYSARENCFPLGTGLGGGKEGAQAISVDSLSSLLALGHRFGDTSARQCLLAHTDTLKRHCTLERGGYCAYQSLVKPEGEVALWPRGQAWAMLGLVRAADIWPERFSQDAEAACNGWWRHWGYRVPFQSSGKGVGLPDASASLMAGLAMLKGHHRLGWSACWRARSNALLETAMRCQPDSSRPVFSPAALVAPYTLEPGRVALVQTPWTLFFTLLTLSWLSGRLTLNDVVEVI